MTNSTDELIKQAEALQAEFDKAWEIGERQDYVDVALKSHCLVSALVQEIRRLCSAYEGTLNG